MLGWPVIKRLRYIFNFNQEVIDEFILGTVRKEITPGSKILDAGAGPVRYKKYFTDCTYLTQDFQSNKDLHKDPDDLLQYGGIDYVSDITDIPVENNSFDAVICTEVLEHIPRPDMAIKEFSRILKSGGALYITTPLGSGVHQAPYHFYGGFSPFWYHFNLGKNGFKDITITSKRGFFALYALETIRACMYLVKSKKLTHRAMLPLTFLAMVFLPPVLFHLDAAQLDTIDPTKEFTIGYLVKATKT